MADIVLDTFTGTGTLADHTPDLGPAWTADRPLNQFTLTGSGTMQRATAAGDAGVIFFPDADVGGSIGWETIAIIKRVAPGETLKYLEMEVVDFDPNLYATIYTPSGVNMFLEIGGPSGEYAELELPAPVLDQQLAVRLEVDADRLTIRCYLNDALALTLVETEPIPIITEMTTEVSSRGAPLPVNALTQVRMYNAAPGPEPEPEPEPCCPPLPLRLDLGCGTESCGRAFSDKTIGWSDTVKEDGEYTFPEARLAPVETVYATLPIGRETQEYRLTLGSVLWAPLTIAALEWTGQYFNNTGRKS